MSVDGYSATGNCLNTSDVSGNTTCTEPATSVLFDGCIPALQVEGDMWARQLLVLQRRAFVQIALVFPTPPPQVKGVEIVMFHCPARGGGLREIVFYAYELVSY